MHTRAILTGFTLALTALNAAPARAVAPDVLEAYLTYCTHAIATGDPTGPSLPTGAQANETGAILSEPKVPHFQMRRDSREDWVCELGDKQASVLSRTTEDFLRSVNTVDKYRSTFGDNLYIAATICVGPNAVALILNGPLSDELSMGTAVFSGGDVSGACEG
ncbi:hypothetical protein [Vannielia litorea]|uniref:hypothetical protein n=1 Tax=Vannielia litorea TaxID=1217970 RepID=UPI001C9886BD|nr:hypothetical protein [Vannielia litorea]MBY6049808.1 hypothetical protein [Vannielia litorea]MBY6077222.1 hypothetical protein [Vannielia litorea]